jgi:hypothetical protein
VKPASIKAKGRNAENLFVEFLRSRWPMAERRRLNGSYDRGDVSGVPRTVIEVKSGAKIDLPGWMRELEVEIANDGAEFGCVAIKPRGVTDGAEFYCVLSGERFAVLLELALAAKNNPKEI